MGPQTTSSMLLKVSLMFILSHVTFATYDRCRFVTKKQVFRFNNLDKEEGIQGEVKNESNISEGRIIFKVCSPISEVKIPKQCPINQKSTAYFIDNNNKCSVLTPSTKENKVDWSHKTSGNTTKLMYDNSKLDKTIYPYKIEISLVCDDLDKNGTIKDIFTYSIQDKIISATIVSEKACGYDLDELLEYFYDNKWYIAPVLIILGALLALAGVRLFKIGLFIVGFLLGYFLI